MLLRRHGGMILRAGAAKQRCPQKHDKLVGGRLRGARVRAEAQANDMG